MTATALPPALSSDERIIAAVFGIDWNFTTADTGDFTHGFHPYPAKFIPQISRTLIDLFTMPGDTVADIFCGSGTTLVEAVRAGRDAIGIDANPLATLIARVKGRPLNERERAAVVDCARHAANLIGGFYQDAAHTAALQLDLFDARPMVPPIRDLDFWFPPQRNMNWRL